MTIRPLELDRDADDLVRLVRDAVPTATVNRAAVVHRIESLPERAALRIWVADIDGEAVARADAFMNFFSRDSRSCFIGITVRSDHRRRGTASRLYELARAHAEELGAQRLMTNFYENPGGVAFARARGWYEVRAEAEAVLDPRTVTDRPGPGIELRSVAEVDPRIVHELDLETSLDIPQTETVDDIPYDEWEEHVLRNPLFEPEGSFVAMVDGVAAALSFLVADRESGRATNMYTATRRPYRGRGLALAVKLATTNWAAANGITLISTTNDETNAPMLAINRRLGYQPGGRRVEYLRDDV